MDVIQFVDYAGTLVFAISGIMAGVEKKFDLFGVFILGLVTAIGGGTIRDLLIGSTPVAWMLDPTYIYLILGAMVLCYLFGNQLSRLTKGFFIFDAIGIALFTILGLNKTLDVGLSPVIAVMMGIVSAVFGGVLRDVLSSQVPLIFRKEIYAFACLVGAITFLLVRQLGNENLAIVLSILTVLVIRILAIKKHWHLPFRIRF
jgi:uncharacterized membrane protein YeiH